ncbi:MAG: nucleotidyltransferase family protein [Ruminococcaceae bacterium]|nr:nucleotidyltransferase family protein [Oscillospiraceae bacterium]
MNICGIICEYNPFHNGHLLHIEKTKKELDCGIVCVMCGNYVQRGSLALLRKNARAEAAILSGADVVIELPLPWTISTAERFAHGAVSVFNALGTITHLSFGAENNDTAALQKVAEILCDDDFDNRIMNHYGDGISYATAREKAMSETSPTYAKLLKSPNNILGIEYLKVLIKLKSNILPFSIPRSGAEHDSTAHSSDIASASFIREKANTGEDISHFLPPSSREIYERESHCGHTLISKSDIDRAILISLKKLTVDDFLRYGDVSEGLQHRLFEAVAKCNTLDAAIEYAKTKRYTHARIRRCFLNAFLGVENHLCREDVPYARVLAFNDRGRDILKLSKKASKIPIITKPASIKKEDEKLYKLFALESRADDIYSLFMKNPVEQGRTFKDSPIKL